METHENKELTKKVLNALDPKYILSQDQQSKITNVFRKFRDHEKELQTTAQKAAITGQKHISTFEKGKQLYQKTKEYMGKQAIFNPKGSTYKRGIYNRGKNMPTLNQSITSDDYRKLQRTKGGNKTRKRTNTLANSMRK